MKRSVIAIAAIALTASAAQAQTTTGVARPVSFGVSAGATVPTGDLSDGVSTGFNVAGLLGYQAPAMPVSFRGEVSYDRFGLKNDLDGNVSVLSFNANALYNFPTGSTSGIAPYLIGGLGFSRLSGEVEGEDAPSVSGLGLNGGVGVKIPLSGFSTFVEARYHYVFSKDEDKGTENTQIIPIRFGIMF